MSGKDDATHYRYTWLRAVLQQAELTARAKLVASGLAAEWFNEKTYQCNPSLQTMADYLGVSVDTIRRAIAELTEAGWLGMTRGKWKGTSSNYTFLSPGKVVALQPAKATAKGSNRASKGGQDCNPLPNSKGSNRAAKGSQPCNSHIRKEHRKEHKGRESATARPSPHLSAHVAEASDAAQEWDDWLAAHGKPALAELTALHVAGGYHLTHKRPPRPADTIAHMIAVKLIEWAENEGARRDHAA